MGLTLVQFNDACARLAAERGTPWPTLTFDEKATIRAELDHLLGKIGSEPRLSRDGLPHRAPSPSCWTSSSRHPGQSVLSIVGRDCCRSSCGLFSISRHLD